MSSAESERPAPRKLPGGVTGWIVRRAAGPGADPTGPEARTRIGEWEGYVSTAASILLSMAKVALGMVSGSVSLIADAFNNLADIGSSLIVVVGFRVSRKPRDREHPYGHGRMETVATMILSVILVGVGLEVARAGIRRLLDPEPCYAPWWLVASVFVTVLIKLWLALFARRTARLTGSKTLEADAWNHTFDIASTMLVMVALVGSKLGWQRMDGWAAMGVSAFIAYTGIKYVREAVNSLLGEAPSHAELHRIHAIAAAVPGVYGVHDVILHTYGQTKLISMHVEADGRQTALEVHNLAELVERAVAEGTGAKVTVHADPVDHSHPNYGHVAAVLRAVIEQYGDLTGFHDLRIEDNPPGIDVSVDIVVCEDVRVAAFGDLLDRTAAALRQALPAVRDLEMGMETEYASDREFRRRYRPA